MKTTAVWVGVLLLLLAQNAFAGASVAVLMEEPYGDLGAFEPAGHAAVYLNHVCAESLTKLRVCQPGEYGVVLGRHRIGGYDWIAMPLIPYLYSVDDLHEIPAEVDRAQVAGLRDAYRRKYLEALAPDARDGGAPRGDWDQLIGSVFDRTIHGFEVPTTAEQDTHLIALFNNGPNRMRYNALFINCADFVRMVLNIYMPHAINRSFIAELGLTTPKHVARALLKYGHKHPEVKIAAFVIKQVPGSLPRSHAARGVAESLVKSKKYVIPMAVLSPEVTGALVVAYLADGRMELPKNAPIFSVDDMASGSGPGDAAPAKPAPGADRSLVTAVGTTPH